MFGEINILETEKEKFAATKKAELKREREASIIKNLPSAEHVWDFHRNRMSGEELSALKARHEETMKLWRWIDAVLGGKDISSTDRATWEAGIAVVEAHVRANGLCNPEILMAGKYWKWDTFGNVRQRKDPTSIFATTGFFIALPERRVLQLREFAENAKE